MVIFILIACFILVLSLYLKRVYSYWKDRGIEYERPFPFIGGLSFIMRRSFSEYAYDLSVKYPRDYLGIYLGMRPALVVQTPQLARKVFSSEYDNFQDRHLYCHESDPMGSLNIFTVKNPLWKMLRYRLSPMFTSHRLRKITELMNANATELVKKVQRDFVEKKKHVNLKEIFSMYTSDTVAYSVFGIRVSALSDQDSPLWHITNHMVKWTFYRGLEITFIFFLPALGALMRLKLFSKAANDYIKQLYWKIVKDRQNHIKYDDSDLVNHLLKIKEQLELPPEADEDYADNILLAQVAVFILGSIETSSSVLSYSLHELAYHPDEQEKLYSELNNAFLSSEKDYLNYNELLQVDYLTACIHETMRKFPLLPLIDRLCGQTCVLEDGLKIEKGVPVLVNVVAIHNNEKYYPEPEKWKPERFMTGNKQDNREFTFLPFGDGPRFCIGKRYGMMQVRAALSQLIYNYKIEPVVPYKVKPDPHSVILAPQDGLSVKFVPRRTEK
nr:TPA_inf: cytochrome P450 CYP332A4 [Danaus plexippus]